MRVFVLSKTLPESWSELQAMALNKHHPDSVVTLDTKTQGRCYLLSMEVDSRHEAYTLASRAQDLSNPFFEWAECTIHQQINAPGAALAIP